jgi:hypothetical protein
MLCDYEFDYNIASDSSMIELRRISADLLARIISENVGRDSPKPDLDSLILLSNKISRLTGIINPDALLQEKQIRLDTANQTARKLLFDLHRWAEISQEFVGPDGEYLHPMLRIMDALEKVGISATADAGAPQKRGRKEELWHEGGHRIASMVIEALKACGFKGSLSKMQENSATSGICAQIINEILGLNISSSGFAMAMRRRNRSSLNINSGGRPHDLFPKAARIENLDKASL